MGKYTYKIGDGFTIRYGGTEGIRWFNSPPLQSGGAQLPTGGLGAAEPIGMAIEATKAAGMLLQWWEMRKQTLLQTAQFEERRIPWLADMLLQWASEIQDGQVRLDTITYFDREVSRFLNAIREHKPVDAPSTLLLQLDRTAHAMMRLNSVIESLLHENESRQDSIVSTPSSFVYQPFVALLNDHVAADQYLASCNGATQEVVKLQSSLIDRTGTLTFARFLLGPLGLLGAVAFWKFSELCAAEEKAKAQSRMHEFRAIVGLALELRSCRTLLTLAATMPETSKQIDLPDSFQFNSPPTGN